ncbi:hypothetical protein M431DRAFT_6953 [Trichoderma harzianum CBS 226.95]|uniref:Uncharacterized protein n=1 Tax=Trichoderma harzianum CBS 226.95 TaxID=983964 RepID=A0A2T4A8M8_TRIHA|nr:hypothetical protein M431DRAFT_6953 [Trichoderma harzianum CBS 226.95]PTB53430.1 hypothetical protein M431DRAFT_6953 [Trichoderma harzianum CBS 226.95]
MDAPPPIVIGLDGLIKHSLPRIAKFRSAAAAMTNFGRLSPLLKRLQVSVLLLGTIYRKISQNDTMPGSDLCVGICHDSLAQTQGMMEAVMRADDDNAYNVGRGVLVERLPEEIDSFITSVELLRSTYREAQYEFILQSMKELTELRRDYSEHLKQYERTTGSENGTNVTEPETASPPGSSERKSGEEKTKRVEDTAIETSVPVQ